MRTRKADSIVFSPLHARSNFGKLLRRVVDERRSLVIEKRGAPQSGATQHRRLRTSCRA